MGAATPAESYYKYSSTCFLAVTESLFGRGSSAAALYILYSTRFCKTAAAKDPFYEKDVGVSYHSILKCLGVFYKECRYYIQYEQKYSDT